MGFGRVRGTNDWGLCFGEQKSEIFVFSFGELTIFYAIVGRIIGGLWRIIRSGLSWECRVGMNGNRKVKLPPQIRSRRENLLTSLESSTAGQILVDKKLHLDALLLAEWMMESSRFKYWFKCVFSVSLSPFLSEADQSRIGSFSDGDKDMFRFAFLAMRKRWAVPGRYVSVGALPSNTFTGFCGHSMLQHDHLGRPLFNHANLLKQIPSGVRQGYAWGRSRQIRTQSSSLTIPQTFDSATLEQTDPLTDDDIDCDMLANAQDNGLALGVVPPGEKGYRTRRRAVVEKGIRAGFHGGGYSALCIDYRYEDPRTTEQIDTTKLAVAQFSPNPKNLTMGELAKEVDVCYCASGDGFETRMCGQDWTEVVSWADDPRLKGFEDAFFKEGGKLNGVGF